MLALPPHDVVDIRRIESRFGIHGGEVAAPRDRNVRVHRPNGCRNRDCRADLRSGHDTDAHKRMRLPTERIQGRARHMRIHIAIDELIVVLPFQHRSQMQQRERKPNSRRRAHTRVDQENTPVVAHVPLFLG